MLMAPDVLVDTEAPTTIFGPAPNFYNQRARSWDMAEHVYAWKFILMLFTTHDDTIFGTIIMKLFQSYGAFVILTDWLRLLVMCIGFAYRWRSMLIALAIVIAVNTIVIFLWNILAYRRNKKFMSEWKPLFTFQVYRFISMLFRILGLLRAVFIYLPTFTEKPTIPNLENNHLKNDSSDSTVSSQRTPVWLSDDQRFCGYLNALMSDTESTKSTSTPSDISTLSISSPSEDALSLYSSVT